MSINCPLLSEMILRDCMQITDNSVISIAQHRSNMHVLGLNGCEKITDASVVGIAFGCPEMRHLSLRRCSLVTDRAVISVAHGCQDALEHLDLGGCELLTAASITALGDMTNKLKYLNVSRCYACHEQAIFLKRDYPFVELHLEDHCR